MLFVIMTYFSWLFVNIICDVYIIICLNEIWPPYIFMQVHGNQGKIMFEKYTTIGMYILLFTLGKFKLYQTSRVNVEGLIINSAC